VLEVLASDGRAIDEAAVSEAFASKTLRHDKSGDAHYDVVSALIKSLRGSDPDAALYWMFRLLEAGDDPRFVLRRLIIFASEDVGNADPRALELAMATDAAYQRLGLPEGLHALGQCCTYLACAPKSNASYVAWQAAQKDAREAGSLPVPMHLRNAPTRLMKSMGAGEGYRYPHDEGGYAPGVVYLPERLAGRRYYVPTDNGLEARIAARLARLRGEGGGSDEP
ncbi:MAG: replication-associated recombination protein A, partial [Myxococcota bacterium]